MSPVFRRLSLRFAGDLAREAGTQNFRKLNLQSIKPRLLPCLNKHPEWH
jgi:hypothetical protein